MAVELIITLKDDRTLEVRGPIQDKLLCYGMMEIAKDVIRAQEAPKAGIIPIHGNLPENGQH